MRTLVAVAALVASVSTSAGELDGKQIFCESNEERPRGYTFNFGIVAGDIIRLRGSEVSIDSEGSDFLMEYFALPERVDWATPNVIYRLDRQSLTLRAEELSADRNSLTIRTWQCEVFQDRVEYELRLEDALFKERAEIQRRMKDNKI